MINTTFGEWTVIKRNEERSTPRKKYYECVCSCGTVRAVADYSLKSGKSTNCGCKRNRKHGMTKTPFYNIYRGIIQRCNYPKHNRYDYYGGRGIKCEWKSFEEFKKDMYDSYLEHIELYGSKETSIERIDSDGNYNAVNCVWATNTEQANNKSNNVIYPFRGELKTLAEICRETEMPYSVVHDRINRYKWTLEKALCTPVKK